jgi:hypothetical protein
MNRREFLHQLRTPVIALSAVPAAAVAAADRGRQYLDPHFAALKSKYDRVEQRLDHMERSHKRMLKALFALSAVSLGIDLSHLI